MSHQHPKLRLTPLQTRIIWALEEDGESVPCLANTLYKCDGATSCDIQRLDELGDSINELIRLQLLDYSPQWSQGFARYLPLSRVLCRDEMDFWTWNEECGVSVPEVFLTEKGYRALTR